MWYQFDRSKHVRLSHAIMFPKLAPLQTQYKRAFRAFLVFFLAPLLLLAMSLSPPVMLLLFLASHDLSLDDDLRLRGPKEATRAYVAS